jgi:hypothetical protein
MNLNPSSESHQRVSPVQFQGTIAERVSAHLTIGLIRSSPSVFKAPEGSTTVVCIGSKAYGSGLRYWFGFYPHQSEALAQADHAYVALGCGSSDLVFLVPYSEFSQWAAGMGETRSSPRNRVYKHVRIRRVANGYELVLPEQSTNPQLDIYKLPDATGLATHVPSYREFGDAPNDNPTDLQNFARRVRRGQPQFRDNLLRAYGRKCSITGEGPEEVLEAVHIVPHAQSGINELDNGLLMRADLHLLFDDGLLSINPATRNIELDSRLQDTPYWQFNGAQLRLRSDGTQVSSKYLQERVR